MDPTMPPWTLIRPAVVAALLAFIVTIAASDVCAHEEYAAATGRQCGFCHLDPSGGGELTDAGKGYRLAMGAAGGVVETAPGAGAGKAVRGVVRLVCGYLHLLTAIFWFGTILYVHLILKPAYASRGLPRGEVKVGLVSMAIMGLTGAGLMAYRVPNLDYLLTTRFGLLLLAKIALFLVMVASALFVVLVLGPRLKRQKGMVVANTGDMTLEQLGHGDGQEGRPAYVAYQGKVYDVSDSPLWVGGVHMGRHRPGADLTAYLSQAPHGEEKILSMPQIGELVAGGRTDFRDRSERVFYSMAYMNLGCVFLIIFIVAMWRWG